MLLPVIIRNIWAKELAEAAEDVVEVSTEVPTEEGEPAGHVGVVEVVVHDGDGSRSKASRGDAHRTGSARIGDGWSRLPSSSRIQLPGDVEESNSTISKRWIFNPFRSRSSRAEGKLRI